MNFVKHVLCVPIEAPGTEHSYEQSLINKVLSAGSPDQVRKPPWHGVGHLNNQLCQSLRMGLSVKTFQMA